MARNWLWAQASFDGAPFYVDVSDIEIGRRIIVHDYPGSENHDLEDMGRNASRFDVTAYFVSETADADSLALRDRLLREGPGVLIIPMFGALRVRAVSGRPSWNRAKLNYVGFSVTFIEETSYAPPVPVGYGAARLAFLGSTLGAALSPSLTDILAGATESGYLRSDIAAAQLFGAALVRDLSIVVPTSSPAVIAMRADLFSLSASLAAPSSVDLPAAQVKLLTALDTVTQGASGPDPVGAFAAAMSRAVADVARRRSQWGVSPAAAIPSILLAAGIACQTARLLAIADYDNRRAAQAARLRIGASISRLVDYADAMGAAALDAFNAMIGVAASHLSSRIASLAPIEIVETSMSLPSNVLAWRLYGDPDRGAELVALNRVATPCFMPLRFEAYTR